LEDNKDFKKLMNWDEEERTEALEESEEKRKTSKKVLKRQVKEKERLRKREIIDERTKSKITTKGKIFMIAGAVAVILGIGLWFLFGYFGIGIDATQTLAKVDNMKVTEKEVSGYMEFLKNQGTTTVPEKTDPQYTVLKQNMLDSLIVLKIIQKYAAENNYTASEKEINDEITRLKANYEDEAAFQKVLKDTKVTMNFLNAQVKDQLIRDKIYTKVTAGLSVTDAEVKEYYDNNITTDFTVPEQVKVSHILIQFKTAEGQEPTDTEKKEAYDKIVEIDKKLKNGEDFEKLAIAYSEDTESAKNGGDIGFISKGQTVQEFESAAFSLETGQVSSIIETTYGYHILKVTDKQQSYVKTLDEVKESIKSYLLGTKQSKAWEDFVYSLIRKSKIVYTTSLKGNLLDIDSQKSTETTATDTSTSSTTTTTDSATTDSAAETS
jgi:parvulin-like peptidyl-prolyl isomerase